MEEAVHVPFNSSDARDFNKKTNKQVAPGPGAYIDINNPQHSSVTKPLLKFSSDRTFAEAHGIKLGAFGSNTKRFDNKLYGIKEVPGPGAYNYARGSTAPGNLSFDVKSIEG
jgi:hypothetical protein